MASRTQAHTFPAWVHEDLDYAAALYLLSCPLLADVDPLRYVDRSTVRIDWSGLLHEAETEGWSHGEQLFVRLACDLFGSSVAEPVSTRTLATVLDPANSQHALNAIAIRAGLLPFDEALAALQG